MIGEGKCHKVTSDTAFPFTPSQGGAASVHADHNESMIGDPLIVEIARLRIRDHISMGAAVDGLDDGIFVQCIEVPGSDDGRVERGIFPDGGEFHIRGERYGRHARGEFANGRF